MVPASSKKEKGGMKASADRSREGVLARANSKKLKVSTSKEEPLTSSESLQRTAENILGEAETVETQAENIAYSTLAQRVGRELARRIGNASKDRVKKLLADIDSNGDGVIQKIELRQLVRNKLQLKADNGEIDKLFDLMDTDHGGTVSFHELMTACHMLNAAAAEGSAQVGEYRMLAADERARAQAYFDAAEGMRAYEEEVIVQAQLEADENLSLEKQIGLALNAGAYKVNQLVGLWSDEKNSGKLSKRKLAKRLGDIGVHTATPEELTVLFDRLAGHTKPSQASTSELEIKTCVEALFQYAAQVAEESQANAAKLTGLKTAARKQQAKLQLIEEQFFSKHEVNERERVVQKATVLAKEATTALAKTAKRALASVIGPQNRPAVKAAANWSPPDTELAA